ncbi:hypothetical protein [Lunatibacter salilacus]|uniref:hypothetical protein n=1 Tax=Lunatibacter salilacus TaxID=2483804 RepID=UPI00131B48FC|nr:hypothetical protein [Lunatibacter salilacus]
MKIYLSLFITVIFRFFVFGQSESVYDGPYEFKGKSGQATFEFNEGTDGEIILNGFFSFDRKEIDSLDQTLLTKFQVKGSYKNNIKEGSWFYDQERHKITLEDVIEFKVLSQLESEDLEIKANYKDGLPHGSWELSEHKFSNNEKSIRAIAEKINFEEGVMTGEISYRNFLGGYTQFLRGKVNERGFMDGEWSLTYLKDSMLISEVRKYENGFLLGVVRRNLDSGDRIDEAIFYSTIEKLNQVNDGLNKTFSISEKVFDYNYNDGFRTGSLERQIQVSGNEFLSNFLKDLLQFDDSIDEDGQLERYPFYTKRFEFDISSDDMDLLVEIPVLFDQIMDSVERYSEMNSLSLNRTKTDSLAFSHAYFANRVEKLHLMENFVNLLRTGEIVHYDLSNYAKDGVDFMFQEDLVTYSYQDITLNKLLPRQVFYDESETFLPKFKTYLDEELRFITDISNYVTSELFEIEINSRLVALEASIVQRKIELDSIYANHLAKSDAEKAFIEDFAVNFLVNRFDELSEVYASSIDFDNKFDQGNVMLDLLGELEKRLPSIAMLFERQIAIDEVYMEETFNPFTYSRYDQRAKERLFQAGETLFYHYMDQLKAENDYTQIKDHINNIEKLQDRMYELRDQDTRTIERRLGKRTSATRIASALGL